MDVLMDRRWYRLSSGSAQVQPHFSPVQLVLEELAGVEGAAGSEAELSGGRGRRPSAARSRKAPQKPERTLAFAQSDGK